MALEQENKALTDGTSGTEDTWDEGKSQRVDVGGCSAGLQTGATGTYHTSWWGIEWPWWAMRGQTTARKAVKDLDR